jgi:hypothetical protein
VYECGTVGYVSSDEERLQRYTVLARKKVQLTEMELEGVSSSQNQLAFMEVNLYRTQYYRGRLYHIQ